MEGTAQPHRSPLLASVSAVLGNDDLLRKILLRLGFPNCLVRASLVSNRWYLCASDPAFLRRFRELHPPRVLGFCVELYSQYLRQRRSRFVQLPPPNELDALVRRSIFNLDLGIFENLRACWNGSILTLPCNGPIRSFKYTVWCPLDHARGTVQLPQPPDSSEYYYGNDIFSSGEDRLSFFSLAMGWRGQQSVADVYKLSEDGGWTIHISATIDIHELEPYVRTLLVDTRIYMLANSDRPVLAILDLVSSSFSAVDLPEACSALSVVDDSICLILVKGLHIHVWINQAENGANWLLLNSICLREMCGDQIKSTCSAAKLCTDGVKAEFVLLQMGRAVYLLDNEHKTIEKVYEVALADVSLRSLFPFLMVWPPIFPVMKEGHSQKE